MALVLPKITWPAGTTTNTLLFILPPTNVASFDYVASRHDNVSSAGVRESIHERIDQFYEFTMGWQTVGTDIDAWATFMAYALQGATFDYYPDATLGAHAVYELWETNGKAAFKQLGRRSFVFKMRLAVSWP